MVPSKSLLLLCAAIPSSSFAYEAETYVEEVIRDLKNVPGGYEHQIAVFDFHGTYKPGDISEELYRNNISDLFPESLSLDDFISAMSLGYDKLAKDKCFPKKLETKIGKDGQTFRQFLEDMYTAVKRDKSVEVKKEWIERYFNLLRPIYSNKDIGRGGCTTRIATSMKAAVLVGLEVEKIKEIARKLNNDIIPKQHELIEELQKKHVQVWFVTASLGIAVEAYLENRLPGVKVLGMEFTRDGVVFKGVQHGVVVWGAGKVTAINNENKGNHRIILAAGDTGGDLQMLQLAEHNGGVSILVMDASATKEEIKQRIEKTCSFCKPAPIRERTAAETSSGKSLRSLGLFDTKQ